jgi:hypothetical protein
MDSRVLKLIVHSIFVITAVAHGMRMIYDMMLLQLIVIELQLVPCRTYR